VIKKSPPFFPLIIFILLIVGVLYFFVGAKFLIIPPGSAATKETTPASITGNTTSTLTDVSIPTNTPTPSPSNTSTPTNLPLPPTSTDTPVPTPTSLPSPTHTPVPPTDTPSPTLTPSPTPEAVVAANSLNLRAGPGTNYEVVATLDRGDILEVTGRIVNNAWVQVVTLNSDQVGWVSAAPSLVEINLDLNNVSVVPAPTPPPPTPTPVPTSPTPAILYLAPRPTSPDNGSGAFGTFPPLFWEWDGRLADDEYFEVRIWHESITDYHPALGWVKGPPFDFNISQERPGKYYWTVAVVKGENVRLKDWIVQSGWPYNMWEGDLGAELSPEGELRFFFFTPSSGSSSGGGQSPISKPCNEPPC